MPMMRCPYCRRDVRWGVTSCPECHAQISYGCKVPVTGCFLTIVVAFLAACVLIPLLSTKDAAGNTTISQQGACIIGALSVLLGLGLWDPDDQNSQEICLLLAPAFRSLVIAGDNYSGYTKRAGILFWLRKGYQGQSSFPNRPRTRPWSAKRSLVVLAK
jgi:hypothetical protein